MQGTNSSVLTIARYPIFRRPINLWSGTNLDIRLSTPFINLGGVLSATNI